MDRLLEILNQESVQVYLGIKATTLPDRGVMRKLDKIAQHAKEGLVVQLLTDEVDEVNRDNSHNEMFGLAVNSVGRTADRLVQ